MYKFVLILFFFTVSCQNGVKNCKIAPDLERIGESALENVENLRETEWRAANMTCEY